MPNSSSLLSQRNLFIISGYLQISAIIPRDTPQTKAHVTAHNNLTSINPVEHPGKEDKNSFKRKFSIRLRSWIRWRCPQTSARTSIKARRRKTGQAQTLALAGAKGTSHRPNQSKFRHPCPQTIWLFWLQLCLFWQGQIARAQPNWHENIWTSGK